MIPDTPAVGIDLCTSCVGVLTVDNFIQTNLDHFPQVLSCCCKCRGIDFYDSLLDSPTSLFVFFDSSSSYDGSEVCLGWGQHLLTSTNLYGSPPVEEECWGSLGPISLKCCHRSPGSFQQSTAESYFRSRMFSRPERSPTREWAHCGRYCIRIQYWGLSFIHESVI